MERIQLIDSAFFFKPTTMAILWILIYSTDWLLDYWGARIYHKRVKKNCLFEKGYNLKAITDQELQQPSRLLIRFLSELLISTTAVWLLLYSCRLYSSWKFYELFCGFFVLLEACIHFRHMRNVAIFSLVKPGSGLYGSLAIPRWMSMRNGFIEFGTFGIAFLIIYFYDNTNFFSLGGVMACFLAILYNFSMSEKERRIFLRDNPPVPESIDIVGSQHKKMDNPE